MSVLKAKRTVSKAEFVNTANQIYVETLNFLTRMSARYARLLAEPVAKLAGEVVDHCEKANSIFPKEAIEKLDRMAANLGEMIDHEDELIKGNIKSVGQSKAKQ